MLNPIKSNFTARKLYTAMEAVKNCGKQNPEKSIKIPIIRRNDSGVATRTSTYPKIFDKSKVMVMSDTNNLAMDLMVVDNKPIEQVKAINYLGLIINEKLSWEEHTKCIKYNIVPFLEILYRMQSIS